MKKMWILGLVVVFSCSMPKNQEMVNYEDEIILVGEVNWDGLTQPPYSEWFRPNYMEYVADSLTLDKLHGHLDDIRIVIFLGTWCTDSQVEVPQFYKILDFLHYDLDNIEVVALEKLEDKRMVSPQHQEEGYGITHVPTFIFKRGGEEIGRITEYPDKTLEKDMTKIVLGE